MSAPRVRRRLFQAVVVLGFVVMAGATYQGVATALERRQFPHPGRMVDVGGHQLHLYCTGDGAPTVVLEAPAAGLSAAWGWVQPAVAKHTRVCSYDRAGLGWSEAGDRAFDPAAASEQLRTLLMRAGEPGPFVLVGQGFGAALARLHTRHFGDDVAALVLVDAPSPDDVNDTGAIVNASPWLARTGVLRVTDVLSKSAAGLPERANGANVAFLNRPDHLARASRELQRWDDTVRLSGHVTLPSALPVLIVDTGQQGRVTLPATRAQADPITSAVRTAIETVRRR